jgi:hypothetical protein
MAVTSPEASVRLPAVTVPVVSIVSVPLDHPPASPSIPDVSRLYIRHVPAKSEVLNVTCALTIKLKLVLLFRGLPLTVMGKVPVGVEALVLIVNVLEQVGLQAGGKNEAVAPEGRPEVTLRLTDCEVPDTKFRVIVFDPDPPCVTVIGPLLVSV